MKPGDPVLEHVVTRVLAGNRTAVDAAAAAARRLGFEPHVIREELRDDAEGAARRVVAALDLAPRHRPVAVVAGGETTVRVVRGGRGGRSQHLALTAALALAGARGSCSPRAPTGSTDPPTSRGPASTARPSPGPGRADSTPSPRSPRPTAIRCWPRAVISCAPGPRARTSPTWWSRSGLRASPALGCRAQTASVSELFVSFQGEGAHAGRRQLFVRFARLPASLPLLRHARQPGASRRVPHPRRRRRARAAEPAHRRRARCRGARAARRIAARCTPSPSPAGSRCRRRSSSSRGCAASRTPPPVLLETAGILPARLRARAAVRRDREPGLQVSEQHRRAGAVGRARGVSATRRGGGPRRLREDAGRRHDRARGGRARRAPRGQRRSRYPAVSHPADGCRGKRVADRRRHPGAACMRWRAVTTRTFVCSPSCTRCSASRDAATLAGDFPVQLITHIARP